VSFYANNTFLGSDQSALHAHGDRLAAGNYALTAVATDGSGLSSTSAPVNITVNRRQRPGLRPDEQRNVSPFLNMPTTFNGAAANAFANRRFQQHANRMTPAAGLIPYTPNTPLWSDGALKTPLHRRAQQRRRHHADEQINFAPTNSWTFPAGTVFVKNV
jgi:hypothetical protein